MKNFLAKIISFTFYVLQRSKFYSNNLCFTVLFVSKATQSRKFSANKISQELFVKLTNFQHFYNLVVRRKNIESDVIQKSFQ